MNREFAGFVFESPHDFLVFEVQCQEIAFVSADVKHVLVDGRRGDHEVTEFQVELFFAAVDVDRSEVLVAAGDESDVSGDGWRTVNSVTGFTFPGLAAVHFQAVQSRVVRAEDDSVFDDGR